MSLSRYALSGMSISKRRRMDETVAIEGGSSLVRTKQSPPAVVTIDSAADLIVRSSFPETDFRVRMEPIFACSEPLQAYITGVLLGKREVPCSVEVQDGLTIIRIQESAPVLHCVLLCCSPSYPPPEIDSEEVLLNTLVALKRWKIDVAVAKLVTVFAKFCAADPLRYFVVACNLQNKPYIEFAAKQSLAIQLDRAQMVRFAPGGSGSAVLSAMDKEHFTVFQNEHRLAATSALGKVGEGNPTEWFQAELSFPWVDADEFKKFCWVSCHVGSRSIPVAVGSKGEIVEVAFWWAFWARKVLCALYKDPNYDIPVGIEGWLTCAKESEKTCRRCPERLKTELPRFIKMLKEQIRSLRDGVSLAQNIYLRYVLTISWT